MFLVIVDRIIIAFNNKIVDDEIQHHYTGINDND